MENTGILCHWVGGNENIAVTFWPQMHSLGPIVGKLWTHIKAETFHK